MRLDELHDRLWAEAKRSVVLVLQGMDAAGKDGTIRRVLSGLNPQGCEVVNFKAAQPARARARLPLAGARRAPGAGILGVMNRSHYEDVVIGAGHRRHRRRPADAPVPPHPGVRAHAHRRGHDRREGLPPHLEGGAARAAPGAHRRPEKNWKFRRADLEVRAKWDEYQEHYERAISATSTSWAPWYVVPGDHKWVRDIAVATLLVDVLDGARPRIPEPEAGLDGVIVE